MIKELLLLLLLLLRAWAPAFGSFFDLVMIGAYF